MDQTVRTASQLAVPMEYDAVQCSCSSQANDRCVQCLERVAACTLLYFSKNSSSLSSVIDLSSRGTPASNVALPISQPVTAVKTSLFACSSSSIAGKSMESLSNHWTESRTTSAPTPPPSDVDSGVMSPPSSSFSTDDSGESEDDDIPPVMKKSRLLELLTSNDSTTPVNNWQSALSSQFHPLDLSCHGNATKDQPTLPTTTTIPATVTRHRAPQIVPQNSNPRTSVSHVQSEIVSTASKRKQVQPIAPNPIGRQPHSPMTNVGRGYVSESPVPLPGSAGCVDVLVNSTVAPKTTVPLSCFSLVEADPRSAQLATDCVQEGNGSYHASTRQLTSLPIICTSVGGLLMPLSSTPATIIVVNCPPVSLPTNKPVATTTTTPLKSNSGTGFVSCAGGSSSSSSSSGSRLCPIAPAPPSMLSSNVSSLVCDAAKEHGNVAIGARRMSSTHSDPQRKTFSCDEPGCGKTYFKNSHLKVHKRVHTGEKPFVCEYPECSKKFARSDELSRHRRTHTGEKRYACTVCEQHFVRSDHLSKHLHRHVLCRTSSTSSATSQLPN